MTMMRPHTVWWCFNWSELERDRERKRACGTVHALESSQINKHECHEIKPIGHFVCGHSFSFLSLSISFALTLDDCKLAKLAIRSYQSRGIRTCYFMFRYYSYLLFSYSAHESWIMNHVCPHALCPFVYLMCDSKLYWILCHKTQERKNWLTMNRTFDWLWIKWNTGGEKAPAMPLAGLTT